MIVFETFIGLYLRIYETYIDKWHSNWSLPYRGKDGLFHYLKKEKTMIQFVELKVSAIVIYLEALFSCLHYLIIH